MSIHNSTHQLDSSRREEIQRVLRLRARASARQRERERDVYLVEAEEDEQRNVDQCGVSPLVEREAAVGVGVEFGDHVFEDLRGRHNASHRQTRINV